MDAIVVAALATEWSGAWPMRTPGAVPVHRDHLILQLPRDTPGMSRSNCSLGKIPSADLRKCRVKPACGSRR
jgi:hypothetical protein